VGQKDITPSIGTLGVMKEKLVLDTAIVSHHPEQVLIIISTKITLIRPMLCWAKRVGCRSNCSVEKSGVEIVIMGLNSGVGWCLKRHLTCW